jgi:hypothetical protein
MPNIQAAMKKTATTQPTLARRLVVLDGFLFGSFSAGLAMRDRSFLPFKLLSLKAFPNQVKHHWPCRRALPANFPLDSAGCMA